MNGLEFYLLEFIDATYWLIVLFYPCKGYEECIKKIETLKQMRLKSIILTSYTPQNHFQEDST